MWNKTNGIVERNQWNRSTKLIGLLKEVNGFVEKNWLINYIKTPELLKKTGGIIILFACGATRIYMNTHEWNRE